MVTIVIEGIVKITVGGRITLPKETRDALGWVKDTKLRVIRDEGKVILESVEVK